MIPSSPLCAVSADYYSDIKILLQPGCSQEAATGPPAISPLLQSQAHSALLQVACSTHLPLLCGTWRPEEDHPRL